MPEMYPISRPAQAKEAEAEVGNRRYGLVRKLILQTRSLSFIRNAGLLSIGTAVAQGFSFLAAPLLTRIYPAQAIGQLALFTSFISVSSVAMSLKYELGIVSAANDVEAAQLTYASILLSIPVSFLSGGILYVAIRTSCLGYGSLPWFSIPFMVATLAPIGAFTALRYWAIRQDKFAIVSKTTIRQHASRAIGQVVFGLIAPGPGGLMAGELIGRVTGVTPLLREAQSKISNLVSGLSVRDLLHTLNVNRKLMVYSLPSTFIDTLVASLPVPFLVKLYGIEAGGYFALVQRVLAVPLGLVATSVADTFHRSLSIYARDNPTEMLRLFKRTSLWLFVIGLGPSIILAVFGESLFRVIFGHQWAIAGVLAGLSTPWFLTQFVVSPLSRLVFVLNGQELKLIYDVVILIGMFAVTMVSFRAGWTLNRTVWAFSLINTVAYLVYYLILIGIIVKAIPGHEREIRE